MAFQVYKVRSFQSDVPTAPVKFAVLDADFPEIFVSSVVTKLGETYATDCMGSRYPVHGVGQTAGEAMEDFWGSGVDQEQRNPTVSVFAT